jgi:hypothetical protein
MQTRAYNMHGALQYQCWGIFAIAHEEAQANLQYLCTASRNAALQSYTSVLVGMRKQRIFTSVQPSYLYGSFRWVRYPIWAFSSARRRLHVQYPLCVCLVFIVFDILTRL